jgi:hypothetical protein
MRNENEIKLKRAYWEGVYYSLNPAERHKSDKAKKEWLTAEVWLSALDWSLGLVTNSATTLGRESNINDGRDI